VSAASLTMTQHRERQKESCCTQLGRPGFTKHKRTQNLPALPYS
jgi:hypothetical protein